MLGPAETEKVKAGKKLWDLEEGGGGAEHKYRGEESQTKLGAKMTFGQA